MTRRQGDPCSPSRSFSRRSKARWESLERRLADVLEGAQRGSTVIVSTSPESDVPEAYVQFAVGDGTIYVEAKSNVYLQEWEQLDHTQEDTLRDLGWDEPGRTGNWSAELCGPDAADLAAGLAVATVRRVYGEPDPARLSVQPDELAPTLDVIPFSDTSEEQDPDTAPTLLERFAVIAEGYGTYAGRSPDGIHSVLVDDEFFRIAVDDLDAVVAANIAVVAGADFTGTEDDLHDLAGAAGAAGGYVAGTTTEEDGSRTVWLRHTVVTDPDDDSLESVLVMCWQMAEAARWARVLLGGAVDQD